MTGLAQPLIVVGALLLVGLLADALARRTFLPRVTLLLLLGLLAGPLALDVLPPSREAWFNVSATIALVMIGFLLGGEFTRRHVKELEHEVLRIGLLEASITAGVVLAGLMILGAGTVLAFCLAGIAAATAPAATLAVIRDSEAEGRFVDVLKGVVAVDDVIGILLFSLLATAATAMAQGVLDWGVALEGLREVGGSVALGLALGVPAAPLTGRIRKGETTLEEALGLVLLCAGLALWLDLSPILSAMVMGASLANLATHHDRPFHEIESIEWPFLVIFFILAGASLEVDALGDVGWVAAAYVLLRTAGKLVGPWTGARLGGLSFEGGRWLGLALLPQAGVALGLALAASIRFPNSGRAILNIVVVGTVVFELLGPVFTRWALKLGRGGDGSA